MRFIDLEDDFSSSNRLRSHFVDLIIGMIPCDLVPTGVANLGPAVLNTKGPFIAQNPLLRDWDLLNLIVQKGIILLMIWNLCLTNDFQTSGPHDPHQVEHIYIMPGLSLTQKNLVDLVTPSRATAAPQPKLNHSQMLPTFVGPPPLPNVLLEHLQLSHVPPPCGKDPQILPFGMQSSIRKNRQVNLQLFTLEIFRTITLVSMR